MPFSLQDATAPEAAKQPTSTPVQKGFSLSEALGTDPQNAPAEEGDEGFVRAVGGATRAIVQNAVVGTAAAAMRTGNRLIPGKNKQATEEDINRRQAELSYEPGPGGQQILKNLTGLVKPISSALHRATATIVGEQNVATAADASVFLGTGITVGAAVRKIMKAERATAKLTETVRESHQATAPSGVEHTAANFESPKPPSGKLGEYLDQTLRAINPEGLGKEAKIAASVIANKTAEQIHETAVWQAQSKARQGFWNKAATKVQVPQADRTFKEMSAADSFAQKIMDKKPENNPALKPIRQKYVQWAAQIAKQNAANGVKDAPKKLEEIFAKAKPGDNPESVMLRHQYESDANDMRSAIFKDLTKFGVAKKIPSKIEQEISKLPDKTTAPKPRGRMVEGKFVPSSGQDLALMALRTSKGTAEGVSKEAPWEGAVKRSAPDGSQYWVHPYAAAVMKNAFESYSPWSDPSMVGDAFRGAMRIKNTIVPLRLGASLFHPVHVLGIDNANYIKTAWKEMLAGRQNPLTALAKTVEGVTLHRSFWANPRVGGKLRAAFNGKIDAASLNGNDALALQYMLEGGFVPQMHDMYRAAAEGTFTKALQEHNFLKAGFKLPGALIATLAKPIFEVWIPNLKTAAYLNDARSLMKMRPELAEMPLERQLSLRKIQKSIDNRYGEMNYDTLFWKPIIKDLAVLNTLSLGWQLGFLREYGGGAMDLGQFAGKGGKIAAIRAGQLDRPLFVAAYTTTALGYAGLMSVLLGGKKPSELEFQDYVYPLNGEKNEDGSPGRLNTPYYTREFASIAAHMRQQGVVEGLGHLAESKASGVIGLMKDFYTGLDSFNREYRDPNSPLFKQLEQSVSYAMSEAEPISIKSMKGQSTQQKALDVAGFTPAPKYVTKTQTQSDILQTYNKYVRPAETAYDQAQYSDDFKELRQLHQKGDPAEDDKFDKMVEKYELSPKEQRKIEKALDKEDVTMEQRMFQRLPWQQQKHILDRMSDEEREDYLPFSDKTHLRDNYEAPASR